MLVGMWPPILWETNTADHRRSVLCGTRDLNQMMELVGRVQFLNLVSVKKKSSGQCYKTYWKEKGRDFPCNRNNKKRAFQKKLTVLEYIFD